MENNPYSAPEGDLTSQTPTNQPVIHEPRAVPVGNAMSWIGNGFKHFSKDSGTWMGACVVGFIIMMTINIIPFLNILANLTAYIWTAGLLLGCKAQDDGEKFKVEYLFEAFKTHFGKLFLANLATSLIAFVVMGIALGSMFFDVMMGTGFQSEDPQELANNVSKILVPMGIAMLFLIPVGMMSFFAPALIVFHDLDIIEAFKMSFKACLKNIVAFVIYGVVLMFLVILGSIPLMLGLLVVMPMIYGSMYQSYKDIFID